MTEVYQGVRLKLYPNQKQINQIELNFNHNRFVYNQLINWVEEKHQNDEKFPKKFDFSKKVVELKKQHPWLKEADSDSLVRTSFNLRFAYQRMFKHLGRKPKFKSRFNHYQSYKSNKHSNKQNGKITSSNIDLINHKIKLPKLGYIRVIGNLNKIKKSTIKAATIRRTSTNQYFVIIRIQTNVSNEIKTKQSIGLAMGLSVLCTTSDGIKYSTQNYDEKFSERLYLWERKLARRRIKAKKQAEIDKQNAIKLGHSTGQEPDYLEWWEHPNYQHARVQVAKYKLKVANKRKMYLQKLTTDLVRKYDIIKIEDIKVSKLLKNPQFARQIANQSWYMLREMLQYKCDWYHKQLIIVDTNNNSQICNHCGYDDKYHGYNNQLAALTLTTWRCPNCHQQNDFNINMAKNILNSNAKE